MKKVLILASIALVSFGLSASAQGTPPIRGDFSASELSPFVEKEWRASGDAAGSARSMFDSFDSRANLRGGLMKNNLKGQTVYWEHYALSSSIMVHRADSTEAQDFYQEGSARNTGYTYKTRDTKDGINYFERTEFMDEGYVCIWNLLQSFDSEHKKNGKTVDEKSMSGSGSIHVWYTPLKVHIRSCENVFPVYEGGTGAMDFYLSDLQDRWAIDGYTFKLTSMNTGIFTVEQPEVTTDGEGKAHIRLHGIEKGKGRLRVYLNLAQPENNCYVEVEEYYDVEVLEAEKWSYSMSVHDQFSLPAHDYTLSGDFSVVGTLDENDVPSWKMTESSPATRSGGGTFQTMGSFNNADSREDGVSISFDALGIINRSQGAVASHLGTIGEVIPYVESGQLQTTDSKNIVTGMLTTLEEGSWPFYFDVKMMEQFAGSSVSGTSADDLEAATKELEAKRLQEQEQSKNNKKKPKKKGLLGQLREGLDALNQLADVEMPKMDFSNPESWANAPLSPQQEAAKAAEIAYIKEHHCIVIPDVTQLLLPHLGNYIKEGERSGPSGDFSWRQLSGTLTLHKEK